MQRELQHVSALSKIQWYVLKNYIVENNEPWCYHTQFSYHLQIRNLSLPLFHKAISSVLERHPVLRTVLILDEGEPKQAINSELPLKIIFEDISSLTPLAQNEWLNEYLLQDRNKPFDVYNQEQALFRTYLIKRSKESVQFVLVFNHAIWDGWSLAVLLKEIFQHYHNLKDKPILKLKPAYYDYQEFIDYVASLNSFLPAKTFWLEHLRNHQNYSPQQIAPNPDYNNYKPVERLLSAELNAALLRLQPILKVTIKTMFIAQFMRMVEAETKLSYNTIGIVTNGRSTQLKNPLTTLGLLWNMAPLCVEHCDEEVEHIKNINEGLAKISVHGSYPLHHILEDQGKEELFHAAFNFINFESANLLPSDSDISFLEVGGLDKFHYPLHLLVGKNPFNKNISLVLNYDTRYYTKQEIEVKLDRYIEGLTRLTNIKPNITI